MNEEGDGRSAAKDDEPVSVEIIAALDNYLEDLGSTRRPQHPVPAAQDEHILLLAAQLRMARPGAEEPSPAFLSRLENEVRTAVASERKRRPRVTRGGLLRSLAGLAGGAGLGIAGLESLSALQSASRPHDLVTPGTGRWYDIAAVSEMPDGAVKGFTAGGVIGYLFNNGGTFHAVSAICTHMGCKVKPSADAQGELHCLCHGSRFDQRGAVVQGMAPTALPAIALRIEGGRIHALGTLESA